MSGGMPVRESLSVGLPTSPSMTGLGGPMASLAAAVHDGNVEMAEHGLAALDHPVGLTDSNPASSPPLSPRRHLLVGSAGGSGAAMSLSMASGVGLGGGMGSGAVGAGVAVGPQPTLATAGSGVGVIHHHRPLLHPGIPEAMHSEEGSQSGDLEEDFDSNTLSGVMSSVHDRLQDWYDMAREFFDLNAVSIARKIDQAATYGSSSVQVLSWSRCRDLANARDFSHTDTGTDFQNLRAVPCALFLQHLAFIIEQEIGFRTRTWTQPYNSKSCRITVHFPIAGRSIYSVTTPQQEIRVAEAVDAFLDLLRSGDYGSRLAVKQEHE